MKGPHGSDTPLASGARERWIRIEAILDEALELEGSARARFVAEACAGDTDLEAEVSSLLAREDSLAGFLEGPRPSEALRGRRVGPYRLGRVVGEGGMGWVILAERADGLFHRHVALKLLRPSLEGSDAATRFELERRILARLDHPGIAHLIDAGTTPEGHPYLVTEFVEGRPIDAFCREKGLTVRGCLHLFRQVAEAVDHAHRNLLVHRDLKPSNILVTDEGRAKLLDFGIAKVLGPGPDARATPPTRPGRRWATPEYAAPEQLRGDPVTTATDIFQLGLLLFELLCRRRPWQEREGSPGTLERAILESDPPAPSSVGENRRHRGRGRSVDADLDAIVLKALRKDPEDRYSSVRALINDLDHHLEGRPVRAREGTRRYRAGRFLRRHRTETAAAALVTLTLVGGALASAWQAGEARRERDAAALARGEAELALSRAQEVTEILLEVFQAADPTEGSADPRAARSFLALGLEQVERLEGQPNLQASLLDVLSRAHLTVGESDGAEGLALRALEIRTTGGGEPEARVAESLQTLALVRRAQGRYEEADRLLSRALEIQTRALGPDDPALARTLTLQASRMFQQDLDRARELLEEALRIRRSSLGSAHPLVSESLRALGRLERIRGDPDRAVALLSEALSIIQDARGAEHPDVAPAMLDLATAIQYYREADPRAEQLYRTALRIQRESLGDDFPGLTHGLESLAGIHSARGEHEAAEALLREGLALRIRVFGPEHRAVAQGTGYLAGELERQGRLDEAEALRRQELALWERALGPDHWNVAGALVGLGRVLLGQEQLNEAEAHYRRALQIQRGARGEQHGAVAATLGGLARIRAEAGRLDEAERAYREALEILLSQRTGLNPDVRRLREELAALYLRQGRTLEGQELLALAERP